MSGHKTMTVFKRYHLIDDFDLHDALARLDTYLDAGDTSMDTTPTGESASS